MSVGKWNLKCKWDSPGSSPEQLTLFALVCLNDRTKKHRWHQAPDMIIINSGYKECDTQENNCLAFSYEVKYIFIIWFSHPTLKYLPKIDVSTYSPRNLCLHVDRNFINEHLNYKHLRCPPIPHVKQTRIELS